MKKNTLLQVIAALALPVIFYLIISGFKTGTNEVNTISLNTIPAINPPQYIQKDFVNYILNESYGHTNTLCDDEGTNWQLENHLSEYRNQLGFNGIQMYDFHLGSDCMGYFAQPLQGGQITKVQSLIDGAHTNRLKAIYQRSNLSMLCTSQRLIYEVTQPSGNTTTNYGFCYGTTRGKYETESNGTTAIHACVNPLECQIENFDAAPQYICENIYENMQHTDLPFFQGTEREPWHLKPRMKIKKIDFDDPNKQALPVVTIQVFAFNYLNNSIPIAEKTLLVRNFSKQGVSYWGDYTELFFEGINELNLEVSGDDINGLSVGWNETLDPETNCHVDFKIWWHGNVDVWFDKLTVDDDRANVLFAHGYDDYMYTELLNFGGSGSNKMDMFYCDEVVHSQIEASKYVVNYVRSHSPNTRLVVTNTNALNVFGMRKNDWGFKPFLENVHPDYLQTDCHPIWGWKIGANYYDNYYPDNIPDIVVDTSVPTGVTPAGWKVSKETYNNTLQLYYFGDKNPIVNGDPGTFVRQVSLARDNISMYSPNTRFIMQPQLQGWVQETFPYDGKYDQGNREPTNQEYEAEAMISIAHGADGLSWFWFNSFTFEVTAASDAPVNHLTSRNPQLVPRPYKEWYYGLINLDGTPRTVNMWGQNKWEDIGNTNAKILSWKPTLDIIDWFAGYSIHSEGSSHGCIGDIKSIYRNPSTLIFGPEDQIKYWELGLFEESQPNLNYEKYFMLVNRRCIPETSPGEGDIRQLKIKFNPDILRNYTNWILTEMENNTSITFDKNNQGTDGFLDIGNSVSSMGYFNPGEGKLFKLVPVIVKGGILVADENITGESFTCEAPVYNNGHNITIGANTTIHFNDSSRFVMDGGVFTVGDQNTSAPQNITSDAVPGGSWKGHSFTNCEVKIYGATFTGLANDTTYAVNIIDCPVVDIRNCTFNPNSSLKGGINAICFNNPFIAINNIYIGSNTFTSSGSTIPTINVSSYAGVTTPLIIENNTFNEGNTAVFLSGVIGGAIKGNTITDNYIGINALTSSIDVVQNNISSTVNGSMGIFAAGGSELKLNGSGAFTLGGLNNISNEGIGTNNINVDGSYFLLDDGENIFNISSDQSSYHLYGYFPMFTAVTTEETNNCFKVNSSPVDPPINMVTSGYQGSQITFNFIPYLSGCEIIGGGDGLVINLGDGIYDTIYTGGSGSGGSKSSNNRIPLLRGVTAKGSRGVFVITTAKEKYDSVCVLMRYRNYSQAKTKCLDLINTYPDSIQSLNAVSKLFLATVASDTSYNAANTLKIFYENLILNHQSNTSLVKRANYYILKCKVRMREYSQALAGFQQIINQNPYSYEGLIARWDYMATSLLIQGQGGAYSSIDNDQLTMNNYDIDGNDDDKKPFTKEQRQDIRKSINTAIDVSKNNDETKMKTLEEKSELGDVNASKELTQMKSLKQVVKTEEPKSITQHIKIVSEDIRKVFGSNTSGKGNQPKNLPTVFRISQNYPNPFNPVTKINYDLPKDSKVKIVIYDILGREVKRLVNNELKTAGSYIVDFNAMNYASGVYFYRIEAEEPNGNKFVDSKKMVLIK